jgi:hypothetical protein
LLICHQILSRTATNTRAQRILLHRPLAGRELGAHFNDGSLHANPRASRLMHGPRGAPSRRSTRVS